MSRTLPVTNPALSLVPDKMTRPSLYQRPLKGGSRETSKEKEKWGKKNTSSMYSSDLQLYITSLSVSISLSSSAWGGENVVVVSTAHY